MNDTPASYLNEATLLKVHGLRRVDVENSAMKNNCTFIKTIIITGIHGKIGSRWSVLGGTSRNKCLQTKARVRPNTNRSLLSFCRYSQVGWQIHIIKRIISFGLLLKRRNFEVIATQQGANKR